MPVFLITATDENDKRETHRVEAENSQDAYHDLESRGFSEIVLHTDDAAAATSSLFPNRAEIEELVSAADMVKFQSLSNFQLFLLSVGKGLWSIRLPLVILGVVLLYRWKFSIRLMIIDYGFLFLLFVPILISFWSVYFSTGQKYNKLMQSFAWARWQEVLKRVPALRGHVPEFELEARRAVALTALGDFDQGLAVIKPFEADPEIPRWMYLERLSELYEVVNDQDQVIECMRLAWEEAPGNPTVQMDYAYALLKYQQNLPLAQQLLTEAEQQHLDELLKMILYYFKGLLELNLGHCHVAKEQFLSSLSQLLPIAASQPLLQLFVDLNRAYLAIAHAELGEREQAQKLYKRVEPRLKALGSTSIMDRYAAAIA
ncbi:hypothetical protein Enr17x_44890 [Gimesia fumaroli]|uniref:Tetratricopeptide repeat protein n=2 Tax=Gimesia fumaroli TaxID=2527976 RepID=A0A518IH48_9PLAN|nr:hypothetical protein Enr17x_44890 [Gimesia fumaroli]